MTAMTLAPFYLRFPDEATAQTALAAAGIYVPEIGNNPGYYKQADKGWAFDPIGELTEGGIWDQVTGEELEAPTVREGWHANYIGAALPPELEEYVLDPEPATPYRRFAGF
jgi:hypothetical protein